MSIVGYTKDKLDALFGGKADLTGGTVPDAQLPARLSDVELRAAFVPRWKPNTAYTSGDFVLNPSGQTVQANTSFTSGASYTAGNWTVTSGGGSVTKSAVIATGLAASDINALSSVEPGALVTSPDGVSTTGLWTVERTFTRKPPSRVISRFPSGHGWTGGADDTTDTVYTDRTYKVVTGGSGGTVTISSPTFTAQDWTGLTPRILFKVDDPTKINFITFTIVTSAGNTFGSGQINTSVSNLLAGEYAVVTLPKSLFTATGTPNWASVTQVQMSVKDKATGALTFHLAAVELIPDLSATYPSGVFILECDDGYIGQKNILAPIVGQRGIPVTMNIIADRFTGGTTASGMTAADLRNFQDTFGWQMSCHAYATGIHGGTGLTAAQLDQDFQRQKQWLHANGLHAGTDHYALCPGTGSPVPAGSIMDALRRNFRSVRVNSGFYETTIPADPLRLRSLLYSGNTVSQLETNINAMAGIGGAFVLAVHDVIAGSTDGTSNGLAAPSATSLATVLDYAISKGMAFRTRSDWLEGR